jgi:hypothetical protein
MMIVFWLVAQQVCVFMNAHLQLVLGMDIYQGIIQIHLVRERQTVMM